jgi:uncharacterized protein (DUF1015 family)
VAEICPFRGIHYNESLVNDWSAVICPTYDIINPQLQQELYLRSEYNFVRLEFGRELPQDTTTDNKYTRAVSTMENWLRLGILETDKVPAIYLHDQHFTLQEKEYKRRGITACVRLEEWDKMVIRPHEGTLTEAKSDRLSLLWSLQANTSPILAMFEDRERKISSLLATQEENKPLLDLRQVDGEGHTVWNITEPEVIEQIVTCLAEQPLYIADGHHRYESALTYQREKHACSSPSSGDEAFNYVMMTLVDFSDPGLIVLPPHRLVRGISRQNLTELMAKLKVFFEIEELPLKIPDVWERVDELLILRLRDFASISQMIPYFHSELYKKLDVSIIDHVILENLLALSKDEEQATLAYSYNREGAINKVLTQEYQLAFLLNPVKIEVIKAVADAGDKMPRKSTYFYPKLPAGLVCNRLV